MRKGLLICLLSIFCSITLLSQSVQPADNLPSMPKLQAGFSTLAILANIVKIEVYHRIADEHALGLHLGTYFGTDDVDGLFQDRIPRQSLSGFMLQGLHRYIYETENNGTHFYLEHGPVFYRGHVSYSEMDWVSFQQDGITYYKLEEVFKKYSTSRMGYSGGAGFQVPLHPLYFSMSLHAELLSKLSDEQAPEGYDLDGIINGIDYEGLRILPMLKLGFFLD